MVLPVIEQRDWFCVHVSVRRNIEIVTKGDFNSWTSLQKDNVVIRIFGEDALNRCGEAQKLK